MKPKKIGILTITPNVGFGGIMQAYALQSALHDITGYNACILDYGAHHSTREKASYFIHSLYKIIVKHQFAKLTIQSERNFIGKNVKPFIKKNLNLTRKVDSPADLQRLINDSFDIVVVGSDQVWRPKYVLGIENYFFKGVKDNIVKIAYAASLGVDDWEFSSTETDVCKKLIKKFKYVSVREDSAVSLLRNNLDAEDVDCVMDPTMLLNRNSYKQFIISSCSTNSIFTYVLDTNPELENIVLKIARVLSLPIYRFNTSAEDSLRPLKERVAPSVESWISGIYHSSLVITDSFHGCVFSIIFNKPFYVVINKARGSARFQSLLKWLNLENRIVSSIDEVDKIIDNNSIDWDFVNATINERRQAVIAKLHKVLMFDKHV